MCSAHEKWIPWIDNGHIDSFYRRATDTFYSIGEQWISEYLSSTSLQSIALLYLDVPMFRWRWVQTTNKRSNSHNIQWLSTQNWAVDETVITGNQKQSQNKKYWSSKTTNSILVGYDLSKHTFWWELWLAVAKLVCVIATLRILQCSPL